MIPLLVGFTIKRRHELCVWCSACRRFHRHAWEKKLPLGWKAKKRAQCWRGGFYYIVEGVPDIPAWAARQAARMLALRRPNALRHPDVWVCDGDAPAGIVGPAHRHAPP